MLSKNLTNKRREKDVMKLLVSEYEVIITNPDSNKHSEFTVVFHGPKDSPYEGVRPIPSFPLLTLIGSVESESRPAWRLPL